MLDGLVRYRFGENAELMGAWASTRNKSACRTSRQAEIGGNLASRIDRARLATRLSTASDLELRRELGRLIGAPASCRV